MSPEIQRHTQKIRHRAEVLAVEVLDDLVSELIRANKSGVPRSFLDWVNINATDFVVDCLKKTATKDCLQAAVDSENARLTMRKLVDSWVMPHINHQFKNVASGSSLPGDSADDYNLNDITHHQWQEIDFVI